MNAFIIAKGVIIGLIMASPFGPVGLIFIQRSLENEKFEGFASGLGIATGDMFYSIITVFGISILYDFISAYNTVIKVIAFAILTYMAVRTLSIKTEFEITGSHNRNLTKAFFLSFLLAIYNPSSIVVFAFLFTLFDIGDILTCTNALLLVAGIFIGSPALWFATNYLIHLVREAGKLKYLNLIYRLSGVMLLVLSTILLVSIFKPGIL
jgi:threonine/homoserine/homoserine lactone efflux protein